MTVSRWKGNAITTAKVGTVTVTAGDATTTYTITINGKAVVNYVGSANTTTIAAMPLLPVVPCSRAKTT